MSDPSIASMAVDDPLTLASLRAAFEAYETALGDNDVAALDGFFNPSALTVRYGENECLYGHEAIAAFRRTRPGGSPARELVGTVVTTWGAAFGVTNTEFRRGNGRRGRQSQTWVRFPEGWRVVAAHVSLLPAPIS